MQTASHSKTNQLPGSETEFEDRILGHCEGTLSFDGVGTMR